MGFQKEKEIIIYGKVRPMTTELHALLSFFHLQKNGVNVQPHLEFYCNASLTTKFRLFFWCQMLCVI